MHKLVMFCDFALGLGCFPLLSLEFVFDYEIFLGMYPTILDTLALDRHVNMVVHMVLMRK